MSRQRPANKAWEEFVAWCQARGLKAVPANPWTLAAFVRWCEPRRRPAAIRTLIKGISKIHAEKTRKRLDRHPLVESTLGMIEKRAKSRDHSADLFDDAAVLDSEKPAKRQRQRATATAKATRTARKKRSGGRTLSAQPRLVSRRKLSS